MTGVGRIARRSSTLTAVAAAAVVLLLPAVPLLAVSSQTWRQREQADFATGELKGVSLSADGAVRLAPPLDPLFETDQPYIWALAEDAGGVIYAAGGNEGAIYRIGPDGRGEVFFRADEPQVQALAIGPGGDLYAGTAPGGRIYKIGRDGARAWVHETGEEYVWALQFDRHGNLFAGTGSDGRIIKVEPSGRGGMFFDSAETHIRSLAIDARGGLLAGTDGHGLVFRVSQEGQGFVLYDAPLNEVVALVAAPAGAIYAAVLGESGRSVIREPPRGPVPRPAPDAVPTIPEDGPGPAQQAPQAQSPPQQQQQQQGEQRVVVAMEGKVLSISTDGFGREVWSGKQEAVLSLALSGSGVLLMGSSAEGRIYGLDAAGGVSEIGRSASSQVTALLRRSRPEGAGRKSARPKGRSPAAAGAGRDEFVVGGSNLGSVALLRPGHAAQGTLESRVLDVEAFASWGRVTWRSEAPPGTSVILQARSGNTEEPDRTWSDWGPELSDPRTARLDLPAARFLQWRAVLKTDDPERTPALGEVAVTYMQRNVPPEIAKIETHPPGVAFQKIPTSGAGPQPEARAGGAGVNGGGSILRRARPQSRRTLEPGARSVTWQVSDANGDSLVYDVYYRAVDETTWKPLRSRIDEEFVTLDTAAIPDGTYLVRVVASDAPANPPGEALTAEKVSDQFDIDNTPPRVEQVKAQTQSPGIRLTFAVSDTFSLIREASYAIDAGEWVAAGPRDGLHDDLAETYDLTLAALPPGEHSIVIRAVDAAGNIGAGKAIVRVP